MKTKAYTWALMLGITLAISSCGEKTAGTPGEEFDGQSGLENPPPQTFPNILFFATQNIYLGNMGGREGVDALCDIEKPAQVSDRQVRAFISVESGDGIADMPSNYDVPTDLPIVTMTDVELAVDWSDLMDGSIAMNLSSALSNMPANEYYWTGTMPDGSVSMTCDGWTNNSGGADAGSSDSIDGQWLSSVGSVCSFGRKVLCIAF